MDRSLTEQERRVLLQLIDSDVVDWMERNFYIPDPRDPVTGKQLPPGPIILAEHQKQLLRAALTKDGNGLFPYSTVLYSAVKKSGKTRVAAAVAAWFAATQGGYGEVYCLANDGKQSADRILSAIKQAVQLNPDINWRVTKAKITLPNGTFIEAIPCDPSGQAGSNPSLTVWSEMWGFKQQHKERLWTEMTIPPTRWGKAMRWVESYAGYSDESSVLEDLYNLGTKNSIPHPRFADTELEGYVYENPVAHMLTYWDHEPRMLWQTPAYYSEEAATLRPEEFQRIHRNQWISSIEQFVPEEWWLSCTERLPPLKDGEVMILGADAGVSGDCWGLVGVTRHPDPERRQDVAIRYSHAWKPPKGGKIDFGAPGGPESEIIRLCEKYRVLEVAYDRYQLHRTATEMRNARVANWREFSQAGDRMIADAQLYQLIRDGRIAHSGDHQLTEHIANANVKKAAGEDTKMRIIKKRKDTPVDLTVALSMASDRCLHYRLD